VRIIVATTASAGAGATTVALRPNGGKQWRILYAVGYHNDVAPPRNCVWHCIDPAGGDSLAPDVSLNGLEVLALGGVAANGQSLAVAPFKATLDHYYHFIFDASAGAQSGYIRAVVEEFSGLVDA
ncbi:unnamed protein product, partial [marine sediment metagenome]